jgi:exodeoxyribonuclease VII small subunit
MTSFSFEQAYQRLEIILQKLSSGEVALEDSLKLYEEADKLISACSQKLTSAEQKIQTLIKNRGGDVAVDQTNNPQMESFQHYTHS